jgi:SAM-dependent methyltransferase
MTADVPPWSPQLTTLADAVNDPIAQANVQHNRQFWARYPWPQDGDEWSSPWGGTRTMWEALIRPRIAAYLPAKSILEIAPGHGRCTQFLRAVCDTLTIVDLVPECIEACKRRFGESSGIRYAVNDGWTLPMVPDESIDFAFTWDSLVHVERETIRSYVDELARVLSHGGHAFLHHSNLGAYPDRIADFDWAKDLHARGKTMSAAAMRQACTDAGLHCISQELIPWGSTGLYIDCLSLIRRAEHARCPETMVEEHAWWGREVAQARRIATLYPAPAKAD